MRKGIVMEIDDIFLTMLTPDGEFFRARKNEGNYSVGEEILFFPVEADELRGKFTGLLAFLLKKRFIAAAFVLLLVATSILPFYQNDRAYAYMSIDVNPSIELGVNRKMQVVEATAYNPDGKRILAKTGGWEKKDLASYTKKILNEIKKQGYLKSNHLVVISTVRTQKTEKTAEFMLSSNMSKIQSAVKSDQLDLALVEGSQKDLEKAHKMGITAGKYKENELIKKEKSARFEHTAISGPLGTSHSPHEKKHEWKKKNESALPSKDSPQKKKKLQEKNKKNEIDHSINNELPASDLGDTRRTDRKKESKHHSEKKHNKNRANQDDEKRDTEKKHRNIDNKNQRKNNIHNKDKLNSDNKIQGKEKKQDKRIAHGKAKKKSKEMKERNGKQKLKEKKKSKENGQDNGKKHGNGE